MGEAHETGGRGLRRLTTAGAVVRRWHAAERGAGRHGGPEPRPGDAGRARRQQGRRCRVLVRLRSNSSDRARRQLEMPMSLLPPLLPRAPEKPHRATQHEAVQSVELTERAGTFSCGRETIVERQVHFQSSD